MDLQKFSGMYVRFVDGGMVDGILERIVEVMYQTGDTLPTTYAAGSRAYCYKGADKGKLSIFDGTNWEPQEDEA